MDSSIHVIVYGYPDPQHAQCLNKSNQGPRIKAIAEGCPWLWDLSATCCSAKSPPNDNGHRLLDMQSRDIYSKKLTTLDSQAQECALAEPDTAIHSSLRRIKSPNKAWVRVARERCSSVLMLFKVVLEAGARDRRARQAK